MTATLLKISRKLIAYLTAISICLVIVISVAHLTQSENGDAHHHNCPLCLAGNFVNAAGLPLPDIRIVPEFRYIETQSEFLVFSSYNLPEVFSVFNSCDPPAA